MKTPCEDCLVLASCISKFDSLAPYASTLKLSLKCVLVKNYMMKNGHTHVGLVKIVIKHFSDRIEGKNNENPL